MTSNKAPDAIKHLLKENNSIIIGTLVVLLAVMATMVGVGFTRDTGSRGFLFDLPRGFGHQMKGLDVFGRGIGGVVESLGFSIIAIGEFVTGTGKLMKAFGPLTTILFVPLCVIFYFPPLKRYIIHKIENAIVHVLDNSVGRQESKHRITNGPLALS